MICIVVATEGGRLMRVHEIQEITLPIVSELAQVSNYQLQRL